eukprot:ctg_1526.g628
MAVRGFSPLARGRVALVPVEKGSVQTMTGAFSPIMERVWVDAGGERGVEPVHRRGAPTHARVRAGRSAGGRRSRLRRSTVLGRDAHHPTRSHTVRVARARQRPCGRARGLRLRGAGQDARRCARRRHARTGGARVRHQRGVSPARQSDHGHCARRPGHCPGARAAGCVRRPGAVQLSGDAAAVDVPDGAGVRQHVCAQAESAGAGCFDAVGGAGDGGRRAARRAQRGARRTGGLRGAAR